MHLPDGLLPPSLWIPGWGISGLWLGLNLRQIQHRGDPGRDLPRASLLTAVFFLAGSVQVPVPPASVHLLLNGLLGVLLGPWALPAITVGLLLQAITFGHGGLTSLGVNILIMGIPALLAGWLYRLSRGSWLGAFMAGAVGVGGAVLLFWGTVLLSLGDNPEAERQALLLLVLAHSPLMLIEGGITAGVIGFLRRVKPQLLP
ncbi:MAG: cobalt transporter CbiM [Thermostichales cyanobacterium BF4_bins_65]